MEKTQNTSMWVVLAVAVVASLHMGACMAMNLNYGDALQKSFLFLEAQRSGRLPANQRVNWRGDSGLTDGSSAGVDLVGGYYDAGDNVKFGLPLAYTMTMLSWSVIEYRSQLQSQGQLGYSLEAIKWGTDYFIKAHPEPNVFYGEVGDGDSDHFCWQRPEDMTTSRQVYALSPSRPGSDLAGETAAALAAASIVFRDTDPAYSNELLSHAEQLFTFADTHRGKYDSSIPMAKNYYQSVSGYDDELLWAAIWLHEASGQQNYLDYVANGAQVLGGTGWAMDQFSWENKYVGVQLKATKLLLDGKAGPYAPTFQRYQAKVEYFLCAALHKNNGMQMPKTPGGMYWISYWNNMQYVSTSAFVLTVAHDYYTSAGQQLTHCTSPVDNAELLAAGKSQVDYILGNNNRGQSYLVGFGSNYPQRVHHRAASIVAYRKDPQFVTCKGGYTDWYNTENVNPNLLVGALVGGPDQNDDFVDQRNAYAMTEPATYNTAPLVGVFARLQGGGNAQGSNLGNSALVSPSTHQSQVLHRSHKPHAHKPQVVVMQTLQEEWMFAGKRYYKYRGTVVNEAKHTVESIRIIVHRLYGPLWGLAPVGHVNGNVYTFPVSITELASGQKFDFSYIHHSTQAQIFVGRYSLAK